MLVKKRGLLSFLGGNTVKSGLAWHNQTYFFLFFQVKAHEEKVNREKNKPDVWSLTYYISQNKMNQLRREKGGDLILHED